MGVSIELQVNLKSSGWSKMAKRVEKKDSERFLTIGEVAERTGVATSALRFYEERGLVESVRTRGNHRLYPRAALRRISVIQVAQSLGLTLREIADALATLPDHRAPTRRDWERLSKAWRTQLDERIAALEELSDKLASCIGCGCLSMRSCALYNKGDRVRTNGSGPRYLRGDIPATR